MGTLKLQVMGAERMRVVARRIKEVGRTDLRDRLQREIRDVADDCVQDVKRAVLSIPAKGAPKRRGAAGVRRRTAGAVGLEVRTTGPEIGVAIVCRTARLGDKHAMPGLLNRAKGWRHPVYGNRNVWVHQMGRPWFDATIRQHEDDLRRHLIRVLDEIESQIWR